VKLVDCFEIIKEVPMILISKTAKDFADDFCNYIYQTKNMNYRTDEKSCKWINVSSINLKLLYAEFEWTLIAFSICV